ncbi:uncharacterized protein [Epargyreus clarus]|uniref:uncharacterized protein isoform X3 n=1 Tax=Epargyreus clarus TaxID=520877 RepID=UPI003C2D3E0F
MGFVRLFIGLLVLQLTSSRTLPDEESVVSVYTTLPTTPGNRSLDVYHLIANNIAERITSPIYRFLGITRNKTDTSTTTTKRPFSKIEIVDDAPEDVTKPDLKPVDNEISNDKDVEELSADALKKTDKKPEKITLYSSYLPAKVTELNTTNDVDASVETFGFDDDEFDDGENTPRDGPFVFFLELVGSFFQLVYGGITSLFSSSSSS